MVAKSKHPALIPDLSLPKTVETSWQLGRAVWEEDGTTKYGPWSALHVASALTRGYGGNIQTGFFNGQSDEVLEANRIGAAYAADPYRNTKQ